MVHNQSHPSISVYKPDGLFSVFEDNVLHFYDYFLNCTLRKSDQVIAISHRFTAIFEPLKLLLSLSLHEDSMNTNREHK